MKPRSAGHLHVRRHPRCLAEMMPAPIRPATNRGAVVAFQRLTPDAPHFWPENRRRSAVALRPGVVMRRAVVFVFHVRVLIKSRRWYYGASLSAAAEPGSPHGPCGNEAAARPVTSTLEVRPWRTHN